MHNQVVNTTLTSSSLASINSNLDLSNNFLDETSSEKFKSLTKIYDLIFILFNSNLLLTLRKQLKKKNDKK